MKAHILIVDDEEHIRKMLARHFSYLGYSVDTASDGGEALTKLEEIQTDVVISDIMMPVMDGVQLLQRIRRDFPMTRVIMITGYVRLENALACLRYSADTCIFKPIEDLEELEGAVSNAVRYLQHWQDKLAKLQEIKPVTY